MQDVFHAQLKAAEAKGEEKEVRFHHTFPPYAYAIM